ncbi:MAG: hypothetical protein OWP43_02415 [Sphaerochaetaceae bacterium]|nr:hypothetical protein [Sphaerochaetaceae bacterium]
MNIIKKLKRFIYKVNTFVNLDIKHEIKKQNNRDFYSLYGLIDDSYGLNKDIYRNPKLIISLTTYGDRIYNVYKTIQSLFSQTVKPDKIVLWLAEDEFNDDSLPQILKQMESRGLFICYCEDIKSYKKLIPSLIAYPKDIIITVDDDIIYPFDLVESLYKEYLINPNNIVYNFGKQIKLVKKHELAPYDNWVVKNNSDKSSYMSLGVGVGGVLYPPDSLDKEVINKDKFLSLAPYADDLWFKAMALKKGTKHIQSTYNKSINNTRAFLDKFITIEDEQNSKLSNFNVIKMGNNIQFKKILDSYNLWDYLDNSL